MMFVVLINPASLILLHSGIKQVGEIVTKKNSGLKPKIVALIDPIIISWTIEIIYLDEQNYLVSIGYVTEANENVFVRYSKYKDKTPLLYFTKRAFNKITIFV
jgi:hypothetical protein